MAGYVVKPKSIDPQSATPLLSWILSPRDQNKEISTTQFVAPFLKRFCYYNLAQVILILSVIHKWWAIRFFVAILLPEKHYKYRKKVLIILAYDDIITQKAEKCKRISPLFKPTKRTSFRGAFCRIVSHREIWMSIKIVSQKAGEYNTFHTVSQGIQDIENIPIKTEFIFLT